MTNETGYLLEALESILNVESDAMYGARLRNGKNPTHYPMDIEYHFSKVRAAISKWESENRK